MAKKIKVSGYTQKINYNDGISYRPFSTLNKPLKEGTIFSTGNFNVGVNVDVDRVKEFKTKDFTDYYDLSSIGVDDVNVVDSSIESGVAKLNLNPKILKNYAYFGSLKERVRVSIENILMEYPAGLIINTYYYDNSNGVSQLIPNGSVISTSVDGQLTEIWVDKKNISNPMDINLYNDYGDLYNDENKWRDFTKNYKKYVFKYGDKEYNVVNYKVNAEQFIFVIDTNYEDIDFVELRDSEILIRPNDFEIDLFYNGLDELENNLLNRNTTPKYTYGFNVKEFTDKGIFINTIKKGTWRTIDGYNLDFGTYAFEDYVTTLIDMCDVVDNEDSNLIINQMVSTSLLEFDTVSSDVNENVFDTSQKIKTILSLYGRSFDNVKNYIDGIAFANNVTYDKEDNAPDKYVRDIAKNMGWDLFDTPSSISLVEDIFGDGDMSGDELEVELWRRLVLNSPNLWKSKGTRKAIEFLNNFLGIPKGMIDFNEYVYIAKDSIDVEELKTLLDLLPTSQSIFDIPVDDDGFPSVPNNTEEMYYQKAGGWFTKTGGVDSDIDVNSGNNPHMGGYDGGVSYLKQFKNLIDDFEPIREDYVDVVHTIDNRYKSYNGGKFDYFVPNPVNMSNDLKAKVFIEDKVPLGVDYDDCGCLVTSNKKAMSIIPNVSAEIFDCEFDKVLFGGTSNILTFYNGVNQVPIDPYCCSKFGGAIIHNFTTGADVCANGAILDCGRYEFYRFQSENSYALAEFYDKLNNNAIVTTIGIYPECCPSFTEPRGISAGGVRYTCVRPMVNKCIHLEQLRFDDNPSIPEIDYILMTYTDGITNEQKTTRYLKPPVNNPILAIDAYIKKDTNIIFNLELPFDGGLSEAIYVNESELNIPIYNVGDKPEYDLYNTSETLFRTWIKYEVINCPDEYVVDGCLELLEYTTDNPVGSFDYELIYSSIVTGLPNTQIFGGNLSSFEDYRYHTNIINKNSEIIIKNRGTGLETKIKLGENIPNNTPYDTELFIDVNISGSLGRFKVKYIECTPCEKYETYSLGQVPEAGLGEYYTFVHEQIPNSFSSVVSYECCPVLSLPKQGNDGKLYCGRNVGTNLPCIDMGNLEAFDQVPTTDYTMFMEYKNTVTNKIDYEQAIFSPSIMTFEFPRSLDDETELTIHPIKFITQDIGDVVSESGVKKVTLNTTKLSNLTKLGKRDILIGLISDDNSTTLKLSMSPPVASNDCGETPPDPVADCVELPILKAINTPNGLPDRVYVLDIYKGDVGTSIKERTKVTYSFGEDSNGLDFGQIGDNEDIVISPVMEPSVPFGVVENIDGIENGYRFSKDSIMAFPTDDIRFGVMRNRGVSAQTPVKLDVRFTEMIQDSIRPCATASPCKYTIKSIMLENMKSKDLHLTWGNEDISGLASSGEEFMIDANLENNPIVLNYTGGVISGAGSFEVNNWATKITKADLLTSDYITVRDSNIDGKISDGKIRFIRDC